MISLVVPTLTVTAAGVAACLICMSAWWVREGRADAASEIRCALLAATPRPAMPLLPPDRYVPVLARPAVGQYWAQGTAPVIEGATAEIPIGGGS